jgi:hypothetical protein
LTAVLRDGARKLLAEALEAEIEGFIEQFRGLKDSTGRQRIVRRGIRNSAGFHPPERIKPNQT